MTAWRRYWPQGLVGACALASIVIYAWPSGAEVPPETARPERYAGPVFTDRKGGALPGFSLRLAASGAAEAPPPAEALPVLVGLANGQAYLRSPVSGEVERVVRGQTIDGWTVAAIGSRGVTLRNGEVEHQLRMFATRSVPGADSQKNEMLDDDVIRFGPAS